MHIWILLLVSVLGAYWLLVTVIAILSVRKMSRADALLQSVDEPERLEDPWGVSAWAREHGFTLDSQFDFDSLIGAGGLKLAVECWYLASEKVFLMHYHVTDKCYYEFVSGFEGEYSLTSSKSADSLSLPFPPKAFMQVFEDASLDELMREHQKGVAFLHQRFGLVPVAPDRPLRDLILFTVKTQMALVQSQPLWQLKLAWWHMTRRRRLKNKSVIEQIQGLDGDQ